MNIASDLVTFGQHQLTSNDGFLTNQEINTSELVSCLSVCTNVNIEVKSQEKQSSPPCLYPRLHK